MNRYLAKSDRKPISGCRASNRKGTALPRGSPRVRSFHDLCARAQLRGNIDHDPPSSYHIQSKIYIYIYTYIYVLQSVLQQGEQTGKRHLPSNQAGGGIYAVADTWSQCTHEQSYSDLHLCLQVSWFSIV